MLRRFHFCFRIIEFNQKENHARFFERTRAFSRVNFVPKLKSLSTKTNRGKDGAGKWKKTKGKKEEEGAERRKKFDKIKKQREARIKSGSSS